MVDDDEARDLYLGRLVDGRYRITRCIGSGGMGAVYEAEHEAMGRRVAVKILHASLANDAGVVRRFKNEARASGTLGHPNIARAFDFGRTDDGAPFIAMELLSGSDLARRIADEGPMAVSRAVRIVDQIAAALGAAHEAGIVHRDVKPENVFLVEGDVVKVLDFGISKFTQGSGSVATRAGTFLGSPSFMAPEQVQDASRADARTDVYALGAVLYAMLTAKPMFEATSLPMLIVAIVNDPPTPIDAHRSDLPADVIELVRKMTCKDPSARPASMAEVRAALHALGPTGDAPPTARPTRAPAPAAALVESRIELPVSRRPRQVLAALVVGAIGALGLGGLAVTQLDAEPTPPEDVGAPPAASAAEVEAEVEDEVEDEVAPTSVEPTEAPRSTEVAVSPPTEAPAEPAEAAPAEDPRPRAATPRRRAVVPIPAPRPLGPPPTTMIDGVPIDDEY